MDVEDVLNDVVSMEDLKVSNGLPVTFVEHFFLFALSTARTTRNGTYAVRPLLRSIFRTDPPVRVSVELLHNHFPVVVC